MQQLVSPGFVLPEHDSPGPTFKRLHKKRIYPFRISIPDCPADYYPHSHQLAGKNLSTDHARPLASNSHAQTQTQTSIHAHVSVTDGSYISDSQRRSKMFGAVTLTWAIPLEVHLLGAGLEAYVESKATVSTLRLCAQSADVSKAPLAKLPPEVIPKIVTEIQLQSFEKRLQEWVEGIYCKDGGCRHEEGHYKDHQINLERHIAKLSPPVMQSQEGTKFAKCCKARTSLDQSLLNY